MSIYLNNYSDYITKEMIDELTIESSLSKEEAFKIALAEIIGVYDNKEIMDYYIKDMFKLLDVKKYENNLYYRCIKLDNIKNNNWHIEMKSYQPYEAFVYNDLKIMRDGRIIPQIGFFDTQYEYPCIMENDREWMLITPNEIETMDKPIKDAFGNVLTYGLGLGYFPFMISLKDNVKKVTIVENNENVIKLFKEHILPQFEYKDKIEVVYSDAFHYAKKNIKYDFVFVDIWHDPSDGIDLYLKFKKIEQEGTIYEYWIEDTIKCYLDN